MIKRFSPFTRAPALFGPPAETPVQSFGFGPAPQSRSPWAAADKGMQSGLSMFRADPWQADARNVQSGNPNWNANDFQQSDNPAVWSPLNQQSLWASLLRSYSAPQASSAAPSYNFNP